MRSETKGQHKVGLFLTQRSIGLGWFMRGTRFYLDVGASGGSGDEEEIWQS